MIGQFLRNNRAYNKHLPIILTSGRGDDDDSTDSDDSEDEDDTEDGDNTEDGDDTDDEDDTEDGDKKSGDGDEVGYKYFSHAIKRANILF